MRGVMVSLYVLVLSLLLLLAFADSDKKGGTQTAASATAVTTMSDEARQAIGAGIRTSDPLASGAEELPEVKNEAPPPGAAEPLPRSYENAPPQVPHSLDGLVPITLGNNACVGCHAPEVAKSLGATPLPPTHLEIDLFTKTEEKPLRIDPSRYYCTACHVGQAKVDPPIENFFVPDFRSPDSQWRSDLFERWNEGVK